MNNVIEVSGLNKNYQDFSLKDVSFAVPEGCIAGFIGLNGSGKTTTIRSMLGLAPKDAGNVYMLGKSFDSDEKYIKDRIGVVFDEGYLYESLKMCDMKSIVASAYSRWDDDAYHNLMQRFSLNENQQISTISKGMKMKFALTLALSHNAELLIMDEPTSGLDPLVRRELMDILNDFMKQGGKGVFYSTHITSDLDKFADIIVFINKGKIVFVRDKDELMESFAIVKGDKSLLNSENRKLIMNLKETDYGFHGVSQQVSLLQKSIPSIVTEKANIEDIMLAHVEDKNA